MTKPRVKPAGSKRPQKPMAKHALQGAKSFRRGTLDAKALHAMAKLHRSKHLLEELNEMADDMDSYEGDAYLFEGDLVVDGDFKTSDADATWLVITGDLIVRGLYEDTCNSAPDFVLVQGDLRAEDVITAANLVIDGNLRASGVVVGDYNDGGALVRKDLHATLFQPFDHPFQIVGSVRATYSIADERPPRKIGKGETRWSDVPLAEPFARDELMARVRAGLPILKA
jgi:hypothetical protein